MSALATDLRKTVREELQRSGIADPKAITDMVLKNLDDESFDEAARYGVEQLLVSEARAQRNRAMNPPDPKPSGKWANTAQAAKARPDLFAQRITVGRDEHGRVIHRFLRDCTREDLKAAALLQREKADGLNARAAEYEKLAGKLHGPATVATLSRTTVERIFDA